MSVVAFKVHHLPLIDRIAPPARCLFLAASLLAAPPVPGQAQAIFTPSPVPPRPMGGARVTGQVIGLTGSTARLALRHGRTMVIHLRAAMAAHLVPQIYLGEFLVVQGSLAAPTTMNAAAVTRAKSVPAAWVPDIP
jgi:hypothetical protein